MVEDDRVVFGVGSRIALDLQPQPLHGVVKRCRHADVAKRLGGAVDLVVEASLREHGELMEIVVKPGSVVGDEDPAGLDHRCLGGHAHDLVTLDLHGIDVREAFEPQLLGELDAGRCILDENGAGDKLLGQEAHLAFELRVFEPRAEDMQEEEVSVLCDTPGGADTVIGELAGLCPSGGPNSQADWRPRSGEGEIQGARGRRVG